MPPFQPAVLLLAQLNYIMQ